MEREVVDHLNLTTTSPYGGESGKAVYRLFAVGLCLSGVILLFAYLLSVRLHVNLPPPLFWVSVSIIIGTLVFQIVNLSSPSFARIVLVEILLANLAFHMIYQIPYPGLYGIAPYIDMRYTELIRDAAQVAPSIYPFPLFFIFFAGVSIITGVDLYPLVKYLPSFLDTVDILLLYLIIRSISRNERVSLLASFLFVTLFEHIWLYSTYHYEILGLLLLLTTLYLSPFTTTGYDSLGRRLLSIVSLVALTLAHHLSSAFLLFLLVLYIVTGRISPFLLRKKQLRLPTSFTLLATIVIGSYWLYVYIWPLVTSARFVEWLMFQREYGSGVYGQVLGLVGGYITSVRGYILLYGTFSSYAIFALILCYNLVFNRKKLEVWHYHSTIILFTFGLLGILVTYVMPHRYGVIDSDRVLIWGWLFGFAPLCAAILESKRRWLCRAGIGILVFSLFLSVYHIGFDKWDPATGVSVAAQEEDFTLARSLPFSGNIGLYSGASTVMAIYNVQRWEIPVPRKQALRGLFFLGDYISYRPEDLAGIDSIIVRKRLVRLEKMYESRGELYYKNEEQKLMSDSIWRLSDTGWDGRRYRDKIYDSDGLEVFYSNLAGTPYRAQK